MPSKECIEARARGESGKGLLIVGIIIALVPVAIAILFPLFPAGIAILVIAFLYYCGWILVIGGIIMVIIGIVFKSKERAACGV